ncbi:hypothetical protein BDY21DRAFT_272771, partial [Lineolata rhizophorae]
TSGFKPQQKLPKNWPPNLTYLTSPIYSASITPELRASLTTTTTSPSASPPSSNPTPTNPITTHPPSPFRLPAGPSPHVRIAPITTPAHPAHAQHGLFAATHLPPSSPIVLYLGVVHDSSSSDPTSSYDLSLDRDRGLGVDARRCGNEARFVNDYRGVRPLGPNAEFRDVWVEVGRGRRERMVGVFVVGVGRMGRGKRGIAKGEEVVVSYGKGFWKGRR